MSPLTGAAGPSSGAPLRQAAVALVWINAISVTILIGGEMFAALASLDWALAGIFHLANSVNYVLLAGLMAICAATSWAVFRRAMIVERQLASGTEPKGQN
jgi:hypothetical protein